MGRHHVRDSWTEFEVEQFVIFGVVPKPRTVEIHNPTSPNMREIDVTVTATWFSEPISEDWLRDNRAWRDQAAVVARKRLDLSDRTGWPVIDVQRKPIWDAE